MCKSYTRSLPLHPVGGSVAVHDPEYFKLLEERDTLRSERDALLKRNYDLVSIVLQLRDRWWPFVHGAVSASNTAIGLLKKSADVLSNNNVSTRS